VKDSSVRESIHRHNVEDFARVMTLFSEHPCLEKLAWDGDAESKASDRDFSEILPIDESGRNNRSPELGVI
jgi:hypothetical protein